MVAKMWDIAFGFIIVSLVFVVALELFVDPRAEDALISIAGIVINILFGFKGNSWREKNLLSRGFEFKDTVTAANKDGAIALFIKAT